MAWLSPPVEGYFTSQIALSNDRTFKIVGPCPNNSDFDADVVFTSGALHDLRWWATIAHCHNGVSIKKPNDIIYITTDASSIGWGAVCGADKACGAWTILKQRWHINRLELLAVLFAVKAFVHSKRNLFIKVSCDNTAAVVYITNMGGMCQALDCINTQIWEWCLAQNCIIEACHVPGVENYDADFLSRKQINLE